MGPHTAAARSAGSKVTHAAVADAAKELTDRLDAVKRGFARLLRPHIDPCFGVIETLRQMDGMPPTTSSLSSSGGGADGGGPYLVKLGQCLDRLEKDLVDKPETTSPSRFVERVRECVDEWMEYTPDRLRDRLVDVEIAFEDMVVSKGLASRPLIQLFNERVRTLSVAQKKDVMAIVERYSPRASSSNAGNRVVSFVPDHLPVAAQRRLVAWAESVAPASKRGRPSNNNAAAAAAAAEADRVPRKQPTPAPPPPAPTTVPQPTAVLQQQPHAPVAPSRTAPLAAPADPDADLFAGGDDAEDDDLFHQVMLGGTAAVAPPQPADAQGGGAAAGLRHNDHAHGNFFGDVSPVGSSQGDADDGLFEHIDSEATGLDVLDDDFGS